MKPDHLILLGFGGPRRTEEVRPFLQEIAQRAPIPPSRLDEVEHHYQAVGGTSPYPECAENLRNKIQESLRSHGINLPVFLGMRHGHPSISDTLRTIRNQGLRFGLGMVLATHRCRASFDRYLEALETARHRLGAQDLFYTILESWYDHPLFLNAQLDRVRRVWDGWSHEERQASYLLFTAHSVPLEMATCSRYKEEIRISSQWVAQKLGCVRWGIGFQSRSGPPTEPWLGPDVREVVEALPGDGIRNLLVVPIGFLLDNVEVIYDLDIELKDHTEQLGLRYRRAGTVGDHPDFVCLITQWVGRYL